MSAPTTSSLVIDALTWPRGVEASPPRCCITPIGHYTCKDCRGVAGVSVAVAIHLDARWRQIAPDTALGDEIEAAGYARVAERDLVGVLHENPAALEHCAGADRTVLDLGCGSGILGIGALLLGCAHVTGCDIDPKAPEVAAANAALNGFYDDKFTVCAGDILADAGLRRRLGTGYDIVLANIVADVIIPLAALAPAFLAPGGTFVCSGIIDGREDEVAAALTRAGFTVTAHDTLEEWHCFTAALA